MEYLNKVLGIEVAYEDVEFKHLPNFIVTRYRLQMVSMNEQKMIFLYPKTELSISRASKQLEEMGLLHIKKRGVQRILQSEDSPKMLFQKAGDKLLNPIKRTVYIPKELVGTDLLESGYSALALREDADERVEEAVEEC